MSTAELTKRGTLAIVLAVAANVAVYYLAKALLAIPTTFEPMGSPVRIAVFTLVGGLGAVAAYALVQRRAEDAPRTFVTVAIVALLVSFVPDIGLLFAGWPGTTIQGVATLMVMHVVAAVILVAGLTWGNLGEPDLVAPHEA